MAVWPDVKAALAAAARTLPAFSGAEIVVGSTPSMSAATRYFAVGFVNDEDNAGTYQRAPVYDGTVWSETGEVRSTIVAQAGDADPSVAEAAAFDMADAFDAWVQANRTLGGVLSPDSDIRVSVDVLSIGNSNGTATELVLVVTYTTTT